MSKRQGSFSICLWDSLRYNFDAIITSMRHFPDDRKIQNDNILLCFAKILSHSHEFYCVYRIKRRFICCAGISLWSFCTCDNDKHIYRSRRVPRSGTTNYRILSSASNSLVIPRKTPLIFHREFTPRLRKWQ